MCGLAGFVSSTGLSLPAATVSRVLGQLTHRGPDDHGWLRCEGEGVETGRGLGRVLSGRCVLLHTRLSIIDLTEAGWQPISTASGRHHLIFNGEIYNYVELREELKALGHSFRSRADSEVLVAAYAEWGPSCLRRLVGMFAFAILDVARRRLFLARDFFGIKPLYYARWNGGFAFASEIRVLLSLPGVSRRANPQRLYEYLRFGLTDHGEETCFADIRQLPPAHFLELSLERSEEPQPRRYWGEAPAHAPDASFDEAAAVVRDLFLDSVRLHLRSDVPVGAAFSGGVDSSANVMAMRHIAGESLDLHTFSYVARDPRLNEERWVDLVGRAAGAVVHKIKPTPEGLVQDLDALIEAQDEPFMSTSIYAQYCVFRLAREHGIKVMLDGQGADELLGGYRSYLPARIGSLVRQGRPFAATRFTRAALRLPESGGPRLLLFAGGFLVPTGIERAARRVVRRELVPAWMNREWFSARGVVFQAPWGISGREVLRGQLDQTLFKTSLPMLLRYEDRNSMAFSIESRVPFLTPALVDFVRSLPEDFIIDGRATTKAVFRRAMRGLVPDAVLARRDKVGFATPEHDWLRALGPWITGVVDSEAARATPLLRHDAVVDQWNRSSHGSGNLDPRFWRWVNVIKWADVMNVSFDGR